MHKDLSYPGYADMWLSSGRICSVHFRYHQIEWSYADSRDSQVMGAGDRKGGHGGPGQSTQWTTVDEVTSTRLTITGVSALESVGTCRIWETEANATWVATGCPG